MPKTGQTRQKELRGDSLASALNSAIDGMVTDETPRSDVIASVARAAGIEPLTVNQILQGDEGIMCPPASCIEGFASALGVSQSRLFAAAERDGGEFDERSRDRARVKGLERKLKELEMKIKKMDLEIKEQRCQQK